MNERRFASGNISRRQDRLWVIMPGVVDMDNGKQLENRILMELANIRSDLVLDCAKTHALYSSGLGILIRLHSAVQQMGTKLMMVNVNEEVREVISNVGLNLLLRIFESEDQLK